MRKRGPFNVFCSTAGLALFLCLPWLFLYIESLIPPSFYLLIHFLFVLLRSAWISKRNRVVGKGLFGWHAASCGVCPLWKEGKYRKGGKVRKACKGTNFLENFLDVWSGIPLDRRRLARNPFLVRNRVLKVLPTNAPPNQPPLLSKTFLEYREHRLSLAPRSLFISTDFSKSCGRFHVTYRR